MRIGINIASYLPLAVWFPGKAVQAAKESGYEFLQVLPLRGLYKGSVTPGRYPRFAVNKFALGSMVCSVDYIEDTWNTAQSLSQVLRDMLSKKTGAPTLRDYVIFPTGKGAELLYTGLQQMYETPGRRPRVIGHEFGVWPNLVEVHPGLWLTVDEIIEKAKNYPTPWMGSVRGDDQLDRVLVPDLWHLRHEATPEWIAKTRPAHLTAGSLLGRWQDSLPRLLPYSTAIHVSPSRETPELAACLRGENTELGEMVDCIRESGWDGDLIVEATLGLKGFDFGHLSGVLADFRGWLADRVSR